MKFTMTLDLESARSSQPFPGVIYLRERESDIMLDVLHMLFHRIS